MPNGKLTDNERKDLVDKIIANGCSCFEEGEREILNGFSDSKLQSILNREQELVANAKKEAEKAGKTEPEPKVEPVTNTTPEPKKLTEDEWMANAPDSVRRVVNSAVAWETQQKEKYAAVIVANEKFKGYTKEVLMAKDLPELELLANAAAPEQKEQQPQPHYMGAATAFNAQPDKDELDQDDVLPMPVMNEAELASEALRKAVS